MKATPIDSSVLAGKGGGGAWGVGTVNTGSNPAAGPQGDKSLSTEVTVGPVPSNTSAVAPKSGDLLQQK